MKLSMEEEAFARETAEKILGKERAVAERNRGRIPYTAENHRFNDQCNEQGIYWWTNGFWGGLQWQLWNAAKEEVYRENALFTEEQLDAVFLNYQAMDHDAGFRWLPTAVADFRLSGRDAARNRGLLAAEGLAGRFNERGRFIRAWNDWGDGRDTTGWAIIDCMMNLPLLYWASDTLKDPRFRQIAIAHADTAARYFVREKGTARHIVAFDPETGEFVREYGGQGMGEGSSWTRGQAWAIYGFALSYRHTCLGRYLETACRVADAFLARIPASGLIPVDFEQPENVSWQDATASAIAACGFLELSGLLEKRAEGVHPYGGAGHAEEIANDGGAGHAEEIANDGGRAKAYQRAAIRLLKALEADGVDFDPAHDELLMKGSVAYHDATHEIPIIYGDYYFVEAIWKLTGNELFIW